MTSIIQLIIKKIMKIKLKNKNLLKLHRISYKKTNKKLNTTH